MPHGFKLSQKLLLPCQMKLFYSPNAFIPPQNRRSMFEFSTAASSSTKTPTADSLYFRVTHDVDSRISIVPILEKWVDEGSTVEKSYLQGMVKKLRKMKRYAHALEVSMWMSDRRYFPLSAGDLADRLDLIHKLRGLEHTENYFNNIPIQQKVQQTYGALLKCYVEEKLTEKAVSLFQTMKELKLHTSFSYNMLMSLYSRTEQHEKVEIVFQEMKDKGICPDTFTDSILLNNYATALDITSMEVLIKGIKQRNGMNFYMYAIAARAYIKAGLNERALAKLKKAEKLLPAENTRYAWGFLVTLYGEIAKKEEMYRIWNAYKSSVDKRPNSMFICMIAGLLRLDDVDGAEEFFKEWKSQVTDYDIRIPSLLITAYRKKGLLGKAEWLANEVVQRGEKLSYRTWAQLADGYFEVNQIPNAVEMMKVVLESGKTWWKPSNENAIASMKYFEERKDVEGAEEFVSLLRKLLPLSMEVYHCLIRIYLSNEKAVSGVLARMKADNFEIDEETHRILEGDCQDQVKS